MRSQSGIAGTEGYLAPELYEAAEYSIATDLFGFAGVIFFQLTGQHPPVIPSAAGIRRLLDACGADRTGPLLAAALSADPGFRPRVEGAEDLLGRVAAAVGVGSARRGTAPRRANPISDYPVPASEHTVPLPRPDRDRGLKGEIINLPKSLSGSLLLAGLLFALTLFVVVLIRFLSN
jgi:serine/threonine protein kinase